MRCLDVPAFAVQYHPEAAPGPHDSRYLFDEFRALMGGERLMPRRDDIHRIMVIGSGPIVIGQACEFDYSGTQACKVLRADGFEVSLVNSNPATIMTDPAFADRTYIEPLTPESVLQVLEREKPDALLPTLGGQTGLERQRGARGVGRPRSPRRAHARRLARGDPHGGGSQRLQAGDARRRARRAARREWPTPSTRRSRSATSSATR